MLARAPDSTFWPNSVSSPTIATVCGFGCIDKAVSKKPSEKLRMPSGPFGRIWK